MWKYKTLQDQAEVFDKTQIRSKYIETSNIRDLYAFFGIDISATIDLLAVSQPG